MKIICTFLIIVIFFVLPAVSKNSVKSLVYPEINKFSLPEIQKTTLDNGIKLRVIKSEKVPLVHLKGFFKGGNIYISKDKTGLSSFVSNLLRIGGVDGIKPEKLDEMLESKGIDINIDDKTNYYSVTMSCLKENLEEAISILAKLLMKPSFSKEKFIETKTQLLSTIARRNDNPDSVNTREIKHLIYGKNSPFSQQLEYAYLQSITISDVKANYKKFITPDNFIVGLSGPIEINEVKKIFKKAFEDWKTKSDIPNYPVVKKEKNSFKVGFTAKPGLNQSFISIGHLGQKEEFEKEASVMVFNRIFGLGMGCRLFNIIRTKMGLTYGIYGGIFTKLLFPGINYFVTFTKTKSTLKAINGILDEIKKIRKEKVTKQELDEAKAYFINSFVFKYSSPAKILNTKLINEFYGLRENYSEQLLEKIKKITIEDVQSIANECLEPDNLVIYILGNESLRKELETLGEIKDIDISIPAMQKKKRKNSP